MLTTPIIGWVKCAPSYSFFIPHQERRKPEGGCEKFAFTAIWQKVLRQQALTLSFQTHWEAALALIKVFLLMFMLVLHFNFYLENPTISYLQSRNLFCNTVHSQNLAKITKHTSGDTKISQIFWVCLNTKQQEGRPQSSFPHTQCTFCSWSSLEPENTLLWIWSVCLKISDWTAWPQRGAAGQCKHSTECTPPFLSTSSLSISPL